MVGSFACEGAGVQGRALRGVEEPWAAEGDGVWEGEEGVGGREAEVICCPCVIMLHNAT